MPFLRTALGRSLEKAPESLPSCEPDVAAHYAPDLIRSKPSMPIHAKTLGEAIAAAEEYFQIRIVPHDPPKWFRIYLPGAPEEEFRLVDIHIIREDEHICPKQDLNYPLFDTDTIYIGALAC